MSTLHIWINNEQKKCPVCNTWFKRPRGKSDKVWENSNVVVGIVRLFPDVKLSR